jgi:hypothetical protein
MSADITQTLRLRQLAADYAAAGLDFDAVKLDVPVKAGGTADYTGSEAARLLRDEDGRQAALQAKLLGRGESR